jgi:hypothetical protein
MRAAHEEMPMSLPLLQLLELPHENLLAVGARAARDALAHWPEEWNDYAPGLEALVGLLEARAGLRPDFEVPEQVASLLPLTDGAFDAIRRSVAPSRKAVLAIDALRAVTRAFQQPSRAAAQEIHAAAATRIHDALELLDELDDLGGRSDDRPGGGFGFARPK